MSPTVPQSAWQPLYTGAEADRFRSVVQEIAAALRPRGAPLDSGRIRDPFSLAGGESGRSLFFAYLDRSEPGQGYDEVAVDLLERAIDGMSEEQTIPGLYSGFSGVAWVMEHLEGQLLDSEGEDPGEEVASALASHLQQTPWLRDYDLISGLAGMGVYAAERFPRAHGEACLAAVVARLAETAERGPGTVTWLTPLSLMIERDQKLFPQGNYNLGVAHGVPGVIGVLGEAYAEGVAKEQAKELLDGAVPWLLAQRLPDDSVARFAYNVAVGAAAEPTGTRLAWCYGDLGIAATLLAAARAVGEPEWEGAALDIARSAAVRSIENAGVPDTGLCHGAAGVAHLFNRLYQASGDPVIGDAARRWFDQLLLQRKEGEGLAGFLALLPTDFVSMKVDWRPDPGFLTGVSGIGLALLGAISPVEPAWDRVLLSSIRPRG